MAVPSWGSGGRGFKSRRPDFPTIDVVRSTSTDTTTLVQSQDEISARAFVAGAQASIADFDSGRRLLAQALMTIDEYRAGRTIASDILAARYGSLASLASCVICPHARLRRH